MNPDAAAAIVAHLALVLDENRALNLTAIVDPEEALIKHALDSLLASRFVVGPVTRLADMGSGAGFPGIPLALQMGVTVVLLEARRKKAAFLKRAVEQLAIRRVEIIAERAERVARTEPGTFSHVVTRAVADLPSLVELASPLLADSGHLLAMKGVPTAPELERGRVAAGMCGMEQTCLEQYELADSGAQRTMVVYRKTGAPALRLPRREGVAQRRPLA